MNGILTAQEVAAELKIHINTVYLYISQGKIKGFKLGNRWRVKGNDLELFISARQAGAEPVHTESLPKESG